MLLVWAIIFTILMKYKIMLLNCNIKIIGRNTRKFILWEYHPYSSFFWLLLSHSAKSFELIQILSSTFFNNVFLNIISRYLTCKWGQNAANFENYAFIKINPEIPTYIYDSKFNKHELSNHEIINTLSLIYMLARIFRYRM